jgi:hypothetical protein
VHKVALHVFFLVSSVFIPSLLYNHFNILHPVVCNYYKSNSEGRQSTVIASSRVQQPDQSHIIRLSVRVGGFIISDPERG